MIALDTEVGGVDIHHGNKPFFVTMCRDDRTNIWYEWPVDPRTREPQIPEEDIRELQQLLKVTGGWGIGFSPEIAERHTIVLQNSKFDAAALASIGITDFPWHQCHDTLVASHVLASNQPHDLTSLAILYLSIDIKPWEDRLREACLDARRWAKTEAYDGWRIAREDMPELPSVKSTSKEKIQRGGEAESAWKADAWLPRAMVADWWQKSKAREIWSAGCPAGVARAAWLAELARLDDWAYRPPEVESGDHPWWTVLANYANTDSAVTLALWHVLKAELEKRGLWKIYQWKNRLMRTACRLEKSGITANLERIDEQRREFTARSKACKEHCLRIAGKKGYSLSLPRKGLNNSLRDFCFRKDCLGLPVVKETDKGNASLDKYAMEIYFLTLEPDSDQRDFLNNLMDSRKMDTGLGFLDAYKRYGLPLPDVPGFIRLHPHTNPCGTDSTRFSMANPNGQQISRLEKINLRKGFGPAPGRIWYSADAKNIELRLPAYRAGEQEMIDLFERSKEPPYYGSNHLLNFSIIYSDLWAEETAAVGLDKVGPHVKSKYDGSWYTFAKNTGLGIQYRAGRATADKAAHREGSYDKIISRFGKLHGAGGLNERLVFLARKQGYVETFIDPTIDPTRGYPLMVGRNEYGKVLDTTPLNYVIQGSAGVWMGQAMLRCEAQIDKWHGGDGFDGFITLTVHDELVFDFPLVEDAQGRDANLWRLRILKQLMEKGGDDIGVPTPCSVERHKVSWADGEDITDQLG